MTEQSPRDSEISSAPLRAHVAGETNTAPVHAPSDKAEPTSRESWTSEELLGDRVEVKIVHGGEVYRLRRTRQDKLILYK